MLIITVGSYATEVKYDAIIASCGITIKVDKWALTCSGDLTMHFFDDSCLNGIATGNAAKLTRIKKVMGGAV